MQILKSSFRFGKAVKPAAILSLLCGMFLAAPVQATAPAGGVKEEIAISLASLLRAARAVVSDHQAVINDSSKGDKGFTSAFVLEETTFNFRIETGKAIEEIDPSSLHGRLIRAKLKVIAEVVDEAQPRINKHGVGYKGFLPATFAGRVAQRFNKKHGEIAQIKLTAPKDYVRNAVNLPDVWESNVLEKQFRKPSHAYGKSVADWREKDGRRAFRLIMPEYYTQSCLACHGQPKGAADIAGGAKEGGTLGELGGAISVVIFGG